MLLTSSSAIWRLGFLTLMALAVIFMLLAAFPSSPAPVDLYVDDHDYSGFVPEQSSKESQEPEYEINQNTMDPNLPPDPPIDTEGLTPKQRLTKEMQDMLTWDPPTWIDQHYPPYDLYIDKDYDANRWEGFPMNNDFYINGTLNNLSPNHLVPTPYLPYPNYGSKERQRKFKGEYVPCIGPRGKKLDKNAGDVVAAYRGLPAGFPPAEIGSSEAVGLDSSVCFDRFGKFGPYGFGGSPLGVNDLQTRINWNQVKWGKLQNDCLTKNINRYRNGDIPSLKPTLTKPEQINPDLKARRKTQSEDEPEPKYQPRTAVLIRTWDDFQYRENDIQAIRALVSELSLLSGGEYHVILFVHIRELNEPIYSDPVRYMQLLQEFVPEELRDMAMLWTETVCAQWYPNVGEWSVYYQQFMPLQWFSKNHPEFDYIWNWEMDVRYIGHQYHFFEKLTEFAKKQPRKYLWERNSRYYFPKTHGSYQNFTRATNKIIASSRYLEPVWGPLPMSKDQKVYGPSPPTSMEKDNFEWGVGEEADLITLLPLWDPANTVWAQKNKMFGYEPSDPDWETKPLALQKPFSHIPRRVFINTVVRFSTRLLDAMHEENLLGRSMASEIWPGSVALQHGFKAVYAPHPIYAAHKWPGFYLENVFNPDGWGAGSDGSDSTEDGHGAVYDEERAKNKEPQLGSGPNREGKTGRWGSEYDAPYSPDREHNFAGWSWYFWSDFPKVVYRRWMGFNSSFKIVTIAGPFTHDSMEGAGGPEWEGVFGRMCLPGMILHPIKKAAIDPDGDQGNYEILAS